MHLIENLQFISIIALETYICNFIVTRRAQNVKSYFPKEILKPNMIKNVKDIVVFKSL